MIEVVYRSPSDRLPASRQYCVTSYRLNDAPTFRVYVCEYVEGRTVQFVHVFHSRAKAIASGRAWEASHG